MITNKEIIDIIKLYIERYNEDDLLIDIITDIENDFEAETIKSFYKLTWGE